MVLTLKVAEVALAGTVIDAGTVKTEAALLASVTKVVDATDFDRVTVHVVLAFGPRVEAAHCRLESVTGAVRDSVTGWDEPLSVAVIVAV